MIRSRLPWSRSSPLPSSTGVMYSTASGDVIANPSERRRFPSRLMVLPAVSRLVRDDKEVLLKAPWSGAEAIRDGELIAFYTDAKGFLSTRLQASVTESFDYLKRCLVPERDLLPGPAGLPARVHHAMCVYSRNARMRCGEPIPLYDVNLYLHRTAREVPYVEQLHCLHVEKWEGLVDVAQSALCFEWPLLRADFHYDRKVDHPYWGWKKWERRMRKNDGLLVFYHQVKY